MRTVVITGATSGIGNLLVKEFIKQDCIVFAGYRNVKLKKELTNISENVIPFRIDMSKEWTITDAAKLISNKLEEIGAEKIDLLINAAGCVVAGAMECLEVNKIREQFEINTFSHLQFTQGLFEKLEVNGGGKIINISSTSSFGIYPFIAPYCASKKALDMLFNSLELECKANIKVISIKPGVIKTPIWEKSLEENKGVLGDNIKYQKEFDFMIKNVQKSYQKALNPQKVVDLVVKVDKLEKPKPSYTLGLDAKIAEIISHLPQSWINFIVKKMFEKRCMF